MKKNNTCIVFLLLAVFWGGIVRQGEAVEKCPKSCHCALRKTWTVDDTLTIKDCANKPTNELHDILRRYQDVSVLEILNAGLSSIGDISHLYNLWTLDLSHNNFTTFPCKVSALPKLFTLRLTQNEIQSVHCDMSKLEALAHLSLDYNKLESFPCQLSNLPRLSELYLSHNNIHGVECDMLKLKTLQKLSIDNNKLHQVPCQLSKLSELNHLSLSYNAIQTLNCDLSLLVELEYLYLHHNNLKSVPCELSKLSKLSYLFLSHNVIETLPCHTLSYSHNLILVDLRFNKLTTLPLLKGIQTVQVSNNAVAKFTNKAFQNPNCKDMPDYDLQNNTIQHLMDVFIGWGLPFSDLDVCFNKSIGKVSGNPIICDCRDYIFYKYVHFLRRTLHRTWDLDHQCQSPSGMRGKNASSLALDQFVCTLKDLCPIGCTCVTVPSVKALRVSCQGYPKHTLPHKLPALEEGQFYELYFKHSNLSSLSFRKYFVNTTKVIFSYGSITEVPLVTLKAFSKYVKVLHLDNNRLRSLPENISMIKFESLDELKLKNNPWHCGGCQAQGLSDFVQKYSKEIVNVSLIRCQSPVEAWNKWIVNLDSSASCNKKGSGYIIGIAITLAVFLLVLVSIIILKSRKAKSGKKLIKQHDSGWVVDECEGEGKEFDIFVSYATDDEKYVGEWLIPELEKRGFKVCFHRVHFLGGVPIHVNMHQCIIKSKRMLVFLSQNFVKSNYCMYELDLGLSINIDAGTSRRLITIKEATFDINTLEPSYAAYFATHTYIEQGAVNFWKNLLYTMPQNKMGVVTEADVKETPV